MSPADLATLSLLDPDQGVCPSGHRCHLSSPRERTWATCDYAGLALVCRDITLSEIEIAEAAGADRRLAEWARLYLADRESDT